MFSLPFVNVYEYPETPRQREPDHTHVQPLTRKGLRVPVTRGSPFSTKNHDLCPGLIFGACAEYSEREASESRSGPVQRSRLLVLTKSSALVELQR